MGNKTIGLIVFLAAALLFAGGYGLASLQTQQVRKQLEQEQKKEPKVIFKNAECLK